MIYVTVSKEYQRSYKSEKNLLMIHCIKLQPNFDVVHICYLPGLKLGTKSPLSTSGRINRTDISFLKNPHNIVNMHTQQADVNITVSIRMFMVNW